MTITQELLYLLLLYAVLSDGKLSITTGLLIAFGILILAPCLQRFCCSGNTTTSSGTFSALNSL